MIYPIKETALRWLELILSERFGHEWRLSHSELGLQLKLNGAEGAIFFDVLCNGFVTADSALKHTCWDASQEGWQSILDSPLPAPGFSELTLPLIVQQDAVTFIHYDIIGLVYWVLARVEEIDRHDLDAHSRFPATSSHAYLNDYLNRPVADEWLNILAQVIQRNWPRITLKKHCFTVSVSHDVDLPSMYAFKPWVTVARMMAGHIIKRRDLKSFVTAPYVKLATRGDLMSEDPYNTFDWLMDLSEENNLQSAFYFICGRSNANYDADYEPDNPIIRKLMRRIHERGHEIGLHPSYNTFQSPQSLKYEADRLKRICAEEGIVQERWGGRMHYLRWRQPMTLRAWAQAGMYYDSTLGYADHPGFRCGTCYEYPAFDPVAGEMLSLRVRPLVIMESSVIDTTYMGLEASEEAKTVMLALMNNCRKVRGVATLLWHNSTFFLPAQRQIYCELLKEFRQFHE